MVAGAGGRGDRMHSSVITAEKVGASATEGDSSFDDSIYVR